MRASDPHVTAAADNRCAQMHHHLAEARKLLCLANRKGIRIHQDVLSVVVQADRTCAEQGRIDLDLETRFWHAYGILRRTIQPATRARTYYRAVFYVALAVMLVVQCYFLFGSRVHEQVGRLRTEETQLLGEQAKGAAAADRATEIERSLAQNREAQAAHRKLALWLVPYPRQSVAATSGVAPATGIGSESSFEVALATLRMILDFLAAYLLPALYGLLGACAFVLRQLSADLSRDFSTLRFAHDSRVRYSLRLNIGILAGLAVGWFIDPTQEGSVVANLSPLALAFVAGYGSDLLFAVLDRIVNAFSTQPPADDACARRAPVGRSRGGERAAGSGDRAAAGRRRGRAATERRAGVANEAEPMAPTPSRSRRWPTERGGGGERERAAPGRQASASSSPRSSPST